MSYLVRSLILFCLDFCGSSLPAHSSEFHGKTLVVAAFNYKPFVDEESEEHGYIGEITTVSLKHMGYKTKYLFVPLKRALVLAKKGEDDGVLGAYYSEERTEYLEYSEPMGEIHVNFFALRGKNILEVLLRILTKA